MKESCAVIWCVPERHCSLSGNSTCHFIYFYQWHRFEWNNSVIRTLKTIFFFLLCSISGIFQTELWVCLFITCFIARALQPGISRKKISQPQKMQPKIDTARWSHFFFLQSFGAAEQPGTTGSRCLFVAFSSSHASVRSSETLNIYKLPYTLRPPVYGTSTHCSIIDFILNILLSICLSWRWTSWSPTPKRLAEKKVYETTRR